MIRLNENRILPAVLGLALLSFLIAPLPAGSVQETSKAAVKPEVLKIFAEIAGEFLYTAGGQEAVVAYSVTNSRLWAEDRSSDPYETVEVTPVDLAKLRFEATGAEGNLIAIEFSRDENGKIATSLIKTRGMEVPGKRIK
jgi:hypothetical protein